MSDEENNTLNPEMTHSVPFLEKVNRDYFVDSYLIKPEGVYCKLHPVAGETTLLARQAFALTPTNEVVAAAREENCKKLEGVIYKEWEFLH